MSGPLLGFPREHQGTARHDNPQAYGCLYVAEDPASAVAEASVETLSVDHEATREASTRLGLA